MNVFVFIERRYSDSPHRPVIVMVSFGTRWEIWRTYSSDFDCRQSKPFEKMDLGESRSPNHSCRHCRWPLSSDVVVRCVGVQICVSVSMFPREDHPLCHWWLRMSRQIYSRTWMPHVEQLENNNSSHPSICRFKMFLLSLSFVTDRFRTRSDLFPTRMIGTCRLMIGWWSINSCSRIFLINWIAVWNDWRSVME